MSIISHRKVEGEEEDTTKSGRRQGMADPKTSTSTNKTAVDIIVGVDSYGTKYKELQKIGEGSYSIVMKSRYRVTNIKVAVKKLKHCYRDKSQVEDIPEVKTLRKLPPHPNILQMIETHFDPNAGRVCLVFELMEMNLYELIKDRKKLLGENRVRGMIFQLMRALRHLHKYGIFHRDVKPENILVQTKQGADLLKLADLGSVRAIFSNPPYTEYISTRWYRSPECLLTSGRYNVKMDVWAAGCVFYEILTLRPLFPGSSEIDQINRVHNILGVPSERVLQKLSHWARQEGEGDYGSARQQKQSRFEAIKGLLNGLRNSRSRNVESYLAGSKQSPFAKILPSHISQDAHELLKLMLHYDPDCRPSSHRILQNNYFKELRSKALQGKAQDVNVIGIAETTEVAKVTEPQIPIHVTINEVIDKAEPTATVENKSKIKLKKVDEANVSSKSIVIAHKKPSKASTIVRKNEPIQKTQIPQWQPKARPIPVLMPKLKSDEKEPAKVFSGQAISSHLKKLHTTNNNSSKAKAIGDHAASNMTNNTEPLRKKPPLPFQRVYLNNNTYYHEPTTSLQDNVYDQYTNISNDAFSGSRDADLDTPESVLSWTGRQNNKLSTQYEANTSIKHRNSKKSLKPVKAEVISKKLEKKPTLTSMSKEKDFPRKFVDKNKLSSLAVNRMNETRRVLKLEPIGNSGIKRSILASDIGAEQQRSQEVDKMQHWQANKRVIPVLKAKVKLDEKETPKLLIGQAISSQFKELHSTNHNSKTKPNGDITASNMTKNNGPLRKKPPLPFQRVYLNETKYYNEPTQDKFYGQFTNTSNGAFSGNRDIELVTPESIVSWTGKQNSKLSTQYEANTSIKYRNNKKNLQPIKTELFAKNLEKKPSLTSISKEKEFTRKFVDKNKLNSLAVNRMNETRRVLKLDPIGNSDIKRSFLTTDVTAEQQRLKETEEAPQWQSKKRAIPVLKPKVKLDENRNYVMLKQILPKRPGFSHTHERGIPERVDNVHEPSRIGRLLHEAELRRREQIGVRRKDLKDSSRIPHNNHNHSVLNQRVSFLHSNSNEANYFSSDEDAVTTMRQKFVNLITQRANKRNSEREQLLLDSDEDLNNFRIRIENPRKPIRRPNEQFVQKESKQNIQNSYYHVHNSYRAYNDDKVRLQPQPSQHYNQNKLLQERISEYTPGQGLSQDQYIEQNSTPSHPPGARSNNYLLNSEQSNIAQRVPKYLKPTFKRRGYQ